MKEKLIGKTLARRLFFLFFFHICFHPWPVSQEPGNPGPGVYPARDLFIKKITAGKKNTRFVILFPQQFIFFKMKRSFLANSRPTSLIVFHVLFGYKRKNNKEKWPTSQPRTEETHCNQRGRTGKGTASKHVLCHSSSFSWLQVFPLRRIQKFVGNRGQVINFDSRFLCREKESK